LGPTGAVQAGLFRSICAPVLIWWLENSSDRLGARMSVDQVTRSLMSSLTWLVPPSFQVSTGPLVE